MEIPLKEKYRIAGKAKSQASRSGNSGSGKIKRTLMKGEAEEARKVTEAHRNTKVLDKGRKVKWEVYGR